MPQLLTLILRDRWLIKKVSVRAFAVEEMSVLFIDGDLDNETSSSATMLVAAQRKHAEYVTITCSFCDIKVLREACCYFILNSNIITSHINGFVKTCKVLLELF